MQIFQLLRSITQTPYYAPAPNRRGHKVMMLCDVCLSVVYIGPKSRTERPRKTKIGTEVAHVTRYLDTTIKVKVTRPFCSPLCWRVRRLQRWAWERVAVGNGASQFWTSVQESPSHLLVMKYLVQKD